MSDEKEYLNKILETVLEINRKVDKMASDIDVILQDVADQSTIEDSILTMVDALVANQNNPAKLSSIVAGMAANKAKLIQATVAGTPQANSTLVITPSPVALAGAGTTAQLKVVDPTGADVTATSTYSSSDATKATVSASGLVVEVAAGTAVISVKSGANAGTVNVTTA